MYEGRTQEEEPPLITPRLEKEGKDLGNCGKAFEGICRKQVSLTLEEEDFVESKRFALANVVYE